MEPFTRTPAFMTVSPGVWLCVLLFVGALLYPADAQQLARLLEYRVQLEWANLRCYMVQKKMHRELVAMIEKEWPGMPTPPFKFVRIENRKQPGE